ncbi:Imm40 family immunity protein [uncultured Duncaniella sp.]
MYNHLILAYLQNRSFTKYHKSCPSKSETLRIAEEYYNSNIPILGGDVYFFNNGNIKPTYDNWYCNRNNSETSYEYVARSYQVACDYIKKYPDNANIFFSIVKGHIDE